MTPSFAASLTVAALIAAGACPAAAQTAQTISIPPDLRNVRYCEVITVDRERLTFHVAVYNTLGLNFCPAEQWAKLDARALAKQLDVSRVKLNGPRYWTIDGIEASGATKAGKTVSFGGIGMVERATLTTKLWQGTVGDRFYKANKVARTTVFHYRADRPVYELTAPNGDVYMMQSYAQIVDPKLSVADLPAGPPAEAAEGLELPHAHAGGRLRAEGRWRGLCDQRDPKFLSAPPALDACRHGASSSRLRHSAGVRPKRAQNDLLKCDRSLKPQRKAMPEIFTPRWVSSRSATEQALSRSSSTHWPKVRAHRLEARMQRAQRHAEPIGHALRLQFGLRAGAGGRRRASLRSAVPAAAGPAAGRSRSPAPAGSEILDHQRGRAFAHRRASGQLEHVATREVDVRRTGGQAPHRRLAQPGRAPLEDLARQNDGDAAAAVRMRAAQRPLQIGNPDITRRESERLTALRDVELSAQLQIDRILRFGIVGRFARAADQLVARRLAGRDADRAGRTRAEPRRERPGRRFDIEIENRLADRFAPVGKPLVRAHGVRRPFPHFTSPRFLKFYFTNVSGLHFGQAACAQAQDAWRCGA